ncbi:MAG TPA: 50S ribosomal protein L9 [Acidimicrobiia bacterium]|nr:50S ribosomal protein L9 [Acidimicrobiia bacterium]
MRIVLREDVEHLGTKGDVVDVADGYARNFLVPRGLAMRASKGTIAQAAAMRRNREARDRREREAATAVAAQLRDKRVEVRARAGEGGRLFGSVTAADIADVVRDQLGVEIDRRRVQLDEPLKELGDHEVGVRLHTDVDAVLTVAVVAQ